MGKAGTYAGCLGFVVLIVMLTGLLTNFMNWMLAFLISCLALSFLFVFWFTVSYNRRLNQNRSRLPDYFTGDDR